MIRKLLNMSGAMFRSLMDERIVRDKLVTVRRSAAEELAAIMSAETHHNGTTDSSIIVKEETV